MQMAWSTGTMTTIFGSLVCTELALSGLWVSLHEVGGSSDNHLFYDNSGEITDLSQSNYSNRWSGRSGDEVNNAVENSDECLLHGLLSKSNDQTCMSIMAYCKRTFISFTISFIIHWLYEASMSYFAALNYSHCSAHSSEINKRRRYHNSSWLGMCAFLFIVTILDKIAVTALCWHATWAVWRLFIVQYDISTT